MGAEFTAEQKRWLEGFASGAAAFRTLPVGGAQPEPKGPDAEQIRAQDRATAAGRKLVDQERWKRAEHPLDAYERLKAEAEAGRKPKPEDNFRWRYHGLFYVAPTQDSYMCRMKIPNGILKHWQFEEVARIAEAYGGGYTHATTRCNLQIREIRPENGPALLEALTEIGIVSRGAGADNIRNITGSATAGIDRQELLDTRPHARAWHHHLLNTRALFNLPRKFNVAFDGGGAIPTLEDTNDIGFQAVEVGEGAEVEPGIWYRLALGGITGHKDFARPTGVVVRPHEAVQVADAAIRVWVEHGDRTNRNRSRLKYVLDAWGFEKFLGAVEERLGRTLARVDAAHVKARPAHDRHAHLGVHPQRQPGLNWVGVALPLGRMTADQMRAIADLARRAGDGDVRLTVWQNLILSGVPDAGVEDVKAGLRAIGLDWRASSVRAGLIACTGATGCRFAAAHTKEDGLRIAEHLDGRLALDQPVNIHLTGCHNSCAQHYIGDIGLIGAKVTVNEDGDQVEGYHIHVGGGFGETAAIAGLVYPDVRAEDVPARVEGLLRAYLADRRGEDETFQAFASRHDPEALRALAGRAALQEAA